MPARHEQANRLLSPLPPPARQSPWLPSCRHHNLGRQQAECGTTAVRACQSLSPSRSRGTTYEWSAGPSSGWCWPCWRERRPLRVGVYGQPTRAPRTPGPDALSAPRLPHPEPGARMVQGGGARTRGGLGPYPAHPAPPSGSGPAPCGEGVLPVEAGEDGDMGTGTVRGGGVGDGMVGGGGAGAGRPARGPVPAMRGGIRQGARARGPLSLPQDRGAPRCRPHLLGPLAGADGPWYG